LVPDIVPHSIIPQEAHRPATRRIVGGITILLGLLALAAAWQWTPLSQWLDIPTLVDTVGRFRDTPIAPLLTIGAFLIGGIAVVPVTVLIVVTVLAFGPVLGFIYAFIGTTLSALLTFGIGYVLGFDVVHRFSSPRLKSISHRLARNGVLTTTAVRIVPVAPFSIINMVAGASAIRLRDFILGTVIGELPGLLAIAIFVNQVNNAILHPGSFLVLALVIAALVLGALGLRRWLGPKP
jgi:phospholipase D1/2